MSGTTQKSKSPKFAASLTVAEVGTSLGISTRNVKELIRRGELVGFNVGLGDIRPVLRVTPGELNRYIESRTVVPGDAS